MELVKCNNMRRLYGRLEIGLWTNMKKARLRQGFGKVSMIE